MADDRSGRRRYRDDDRDRWSNEQSRYGSGRNEGLRGHERGDPGRGYDAGREDDGQGYGRGGPENRSQWGAYGGHGGDHDRGDRFRGGFGSSSGGGIRSDGDGGHRGDHGWRGGFDDDRGGQRDDFRRGDFGSYGAAGPSFGGAYGGSSGGQRDDGFRDRSHDDVRHTSRDRGRFNEGGHGHGDRGLLKRAGDEVSSWFGNHDAERRRDEDHHRGRGPKNYARSDDRIREDVNDRLTDDWRVDASDVEVTVQGGEVTLTGTVSSRDQRRRAEDVAEEVSGVKHVQNNLRVRESYNEGGVYGRGESSSASGSTLSTSGGAAATGASLAGGGAQSSVTSNTGPGGGSTSSQS